MSNIYRMKKKKLLIYNKDNLFWRRKEKDIDWAVEDKDGNWWIVPGSEFPEKKITNKKEEDMKCGLPPTFSIRKMAINVVVSVGIGVALGFMVFGALFVWGLATAE